MIVSRTDGLFWANNNDRNSQRKKPPSSYSETTYSIDLCKLFVFIPKLACCYERFYLRNSMCQADRKNSSALVMLIMRISIQKKIIFITVLLGVPTGTGQYPWTFQDIITIFTVFQLKLNPTCYKINVNLYQTYSHGDKV